ncbi:hypothetical protein [Streptomyces sp. NPDC091416]|uniref:hypothetical protein n=1 Tax=Streptomyces sp. NPDC091416 TaxID=3366003 RepID=UPI0037F55D5E
MPTATGPRDQAKALREAAGQLAIALCAFARLVEADADDQLAEGEAAVERLRQASLHVHEHMASTVPVPELEACTTGLVDSNLEKGLSAELLLAGGRSATVRLTHETAHQDIELEDGRTARLPAADHLILRDGFHELARLLAPLTRETTARV